MTRHLLLLASAVVVATVGCQSFHTHSAPPVSGAGGPCDGDDYVIATNMTRRSASVFAVLDESGKEIYVGSVGPNLSTRFELADAGVAGKRAAFISENSLAITGQLASSGRQSANPLAAVTFTRHCDERSDLERGPALHESILSAATDRGYTARIIETRPVKMPDAPVAGILFVPWMSCDPVEVHQPTRDGYLLFVRELATISGMVVDRVEKPGVDGAPGPACDKSGLVDDMAAARAGLAHLRHTRGVDSTRVFIVGGSIGGTVAIALASENPKAARGVVSVNGFAEPWETHMLGYERRRLAGVGYSPDTIEAAMPGFQILYHEFLTNDLTPGQVIAKYPDLSRIWYDSANGQFGRSADYFHQVQKLDIPGLFERCAVPALFVSGQYDWIMGPAEGDSGAAFVNRTHPGNAMSRIYPGMTHGLYVFKSESDALHNVNGRFASQVGRDVIDWIETVK